MASEHFKGYPVVRKPIRLGGREWVCLAPANEDELLDSPQVQARFEVDEYMPYWGQLWPAAPMLAEYVLSDEPGRNRPALEIGCGLGMVSVVSQAMGWQVTATDYDEDALAFTRENGRLNDVGDIRTRLLDWRHPSLLQRFDRILAADVLYEVRNHQPVIDLVRQLLSGEGVALVVDPDRKAARTFEDTLAHAGLEWQTCSLHTTQPYGRYIRGTLYAIRLPSSSTVRP